jgi:uncharacterized membrane protein YdbT with pleckstrin-like domain
MSYVESQLLADEKVSYWAHLHGIIFVPAGVLGVLSLATTAMAFSEPQLRVAAVLWFGLAGIAGVWAWIAYSTSEFAVTNKRVVIKVGLIRRRSLETLLSKVEGVSVDQGLLGRMLDYGTIGITGTGGTRETFTRIGAPLEFRRQVQDAISRQEDRRAGVMPPSDAYPASRCRARNAIAHSARSESWSRPRSASTADAT